MGHRGLVLACSPGRAPALPELPLGNPGLRTQDPAWTQTPPCNICIQNPHGRAVDLRDVTGRRLPVLGALCITGIPQAHLLVQ